MVVFWWWGRPERRRHEVKLVGEGREVVSLHLGVVGCGARDMCNFRERPDDGGGGGAKTLGLPPLKSLLTRPPSSVIGALPKVAHVSDPKPNQTNMKRHHLPPTSNQSRFVSPPLRPSPPPNHRQTTTHHQIHHPPPPPPNPHRRPPPPKNHPKIAHVCPAATTSRNAQPNGPKSTFLHNGNDVFDASYFLRSFN